jgi:hypothetical protein
MGYMDALISGYFKTTQDGGKLFLPWGVLGRGYVIASEQDFKRLQRLIKVYMALSLVLIIGSGWLQPYWGGFAIAALLVVSYAIWVQFVLRRLQPSQERLSLKESVAAGARAHSDASLWLLEIAALAFVGAGILILIVDPHNRLIALACIAFFGLAAVKFTIQLIQRRRRETTGAD